MSGHRRQVIESWLESLDEFGRNEGQWMPLRENFEWVLKLALKGLDASAPEAQAHKGFILVPDEPVMWRREWDGDESDIGAWVYAEEYEETFDGQQWQPLYVKQQK